jgi:hypothetical protein
MLKLRNILSILLVILFLGILLFFAIPNFENKSQIEYAVSIVLVVAFCAFIVYKIMTMGSRMWGPNTLQVNEKLLFEQENTELTSTANSPDAEPASVNYLLRVTNLRFFFLHKNGETIHLIVAFTENPANTLWKMFKNGVVEAKKSDLSVDEYSNVSLKLSVSGREIQFGFKVREKTNLDMLKTKLRI